MVGKVHKCIAYYYRIWNGYKMIAARIVQVSKRCMRDGSGIHLMGRGDRETGSERATNGSPSRCPGALTAPSNDTANSPCTPSIRQLHQQ